MKAPDKIYIEIDNKAHVYFGLQPENAVEYIRKDALLEWAKETYLNENASAIRKVCFKQLVEKLMSM